MTDRQIDPELAGRWYLQVADLKTIIADAAFENVGRIKVEVDRSQRHDFDFGSVFVHRARPETENVTVIGVERLCPVISDRLLHG